MTDAEIKKALECCIIGNCQGCIYGETDQRRCRDDLMQNALDLLNCQQAEIKRLQKELALKGLEYTLLERDRAKDICDFAEELKTIKAEAIKELMFNLDEEISTYSSNGKALNVYAWLKNYVKEMGLK